MTGTHIPTPGLRGINAGQGAGQPGTSAERTMWHDIAGHLTAAPGTNHRAIESPAPTPGQLHAGHWAAHLTDDATGLIFQHPNHPHSHPDPLPEGHRHRAADSCAPFPPSPMRQAADPGAPAATGTGNGIRAQAAELEAGP